MTSDRQQIFGEPLDLVPFPRQSGGDAWFDGIFATFGESQAAVDSALTPSLKKLMLGWQTPLHAEVRPGGFVLSATSLAPDYTGLAWLADATTLFGEKATKVRSGLTRTRTVSLEGARAPARTRVRLSGSDIRSSSCARKA